MSLEVLAIAAALAIVAALYASVGHGGASGYLAVLGLAGLAPEELRPTALLLNIVVSGTATWRFAPHFHWRLFWPFAMASLPCAFLAGRLINLQAGPYQIILAAVLFYAAWRLLTPRWTPAAADERAPRFSIAFVVGALIGVLSGAIGVGGGIFLSPVLILAGWAGPRRTAAISAAFILMNSAAALLGVSLQPASPDLDVASLVLYAVAVLIAGVIGSGLGSSRLDPILLRRLLGIVLVIAALKMLLNAAG